MAAPAIRATRDRLDKSFSMLGFTVRTGRQPFFETVIATDPALLDGSERQRRTASTFWSSRAMGPLPAERGEAVFVVPDDVVRRFAGQERLYYAVATFADWARSSPEVARLPQDLTPFVTLSSGYTGRPPRPQIGGRAGGNRWTGRPANGYGSQNGASLEWAGDAAQPGTEEAPGVSGRSPNGHTTPRDGATPPAGDGQGSAPGPATGAALTYDDGYDGHLWREPRFGRPSVLDASSGAFDIGWPDLPAHRRAGRPVGAGRGRRDGGGLARPEPGRPRSRLAAVGYPPRRAEHRGSRRARRRLGPRRPARATLRRDDAARRGGVARPALGGRHDARLTGAGRDGRLRRRHPRRHLRED